MNALNKILFAALLTAGVSAPAFAQASDTETATSTVTVVSPVVITRNSNLVFATIARPAAGSVNVAMDADTGVTTPAAALVGAGRTRAQFTVTGETGSTVSFDADTSVSMTGTGDAIAVTLTESDVAGTLTGGSAIFYVGGAFTLANDQASGAYSGTFTVTSAYN